MSHAQRRADTLVTPQSDVKATHRRLVGAFPLGRKGNSLLVPLSSLAETPFNSMNSHWVALEVLHKHIHPWLHSSTMHYYSSATGTALQKSTALVQLDSMW